MFTDAFKALRAGLLEVVREFKRRRWARRFHGECEL